MGALHKTIRNRRGGIVTVVSASNSVCLSFRPSVRPCICLSIHPTIHPFCRLCTRVSALLGAIIRIKNAVKPRYSATLLGSREDCEQKFRITQYFDLPPRSISRHKLRWTNSGAIVRVWLIWTRRIITFILMKLQDPIGRCQVLLYC
jgi:hypothetical protein